MYVNIFGVMRVDKMNLQEYFEFTETTKSYPNLVEYDYLTHGIWAEIGEFEGILAKRLRGDEKYKDHEVYINALKFELGDIYWFAVRLLASKEHLENSERFSYIYDNPLLRELVESIKHNLLDKDYLTLLLTLDGIAKVLESTRYEIIELNINKLTERKNTNTIKGDGETVNERFSLGK